MLRNVTKGALLVGAFVAVVVTFVWLNQVELPEGAVPVVWDGEVCGHCKMHVGDPRFAAQLQTADGEVLNFDDPGCLFDYLQSHDVAVHALYFRNYAADAWLAQADVGFLPVDDSPMGYGIRAVPKQTPEANDIEWAKAQVMNRPHHGHGGS